MHPETSPEKWHSVMESGPFYRSVPACMAKERGITTEKPTSGAVEEVGGRVTVWWCWA